MKETKIKIEEKVEKRKPRPGIGIKLLSKTLKIYSVEQEKKNKQN